VHIGEIVKILGMRAKVHIVLRVVILIIKCIKAKWVTNIKKILMTSSLVIRMKLIILISIGGVINHSCRDLMKTTWLIFWKHNINMRLNLKMRKKNYLWTVLISQQFRVLSYLIHQKKKMEKLDTKIFRLHSDNLGSNSMSKMRGYY